MARRSQESANSGYRCPSNPDHGYLLALATGGGTVYHCPHHDHVARGNVSRHTFSLAEAEKAQAAA